MIKVNDYKKFGRQGAMKKSKLHSFRPIEKAVSGMGRSPIYYSETTRENIYEANKQAHKIE